MSILMNRLPALTFILFLIIAGSSSCSLGNNILANGSFESVCEDTGDPSGWHATRVSQTTDFVKFGVIESGLHGLGLAAYIEIDPAHPAEVELGPEYAANRIAYNWTRRISEVKPDSLYLLSGWVKTLDLKSPAWIVAQYLGDVEEFEMLGLGTTQRDFPVSGTSDWTRVAIVLSVPAGTQAIQLRAGISAPQNIGGKVWFDNIQIREILR